jgi:hypothetical protein
MKERKKKNDELAVENYRIRYTLLQCFLIQNAVINAAYFKGENSL